MTRDEPAPGGTPDAEHRDAERREAVARDTEHRDTEHRGTRRRDPVPADDEPIELGELPHGADGPDPADRPAAASAVRGWRGVLTRRRRTLAGVGLLAVGVAGGMILQRGVGVLPDPAPSPSPSFVASADVQVVVPPTGGAVCAAHLAADPYAWHTLGTMRCVGMISRVDGDAVTLSSDRGGSVTFLVDDDTVLRDIRSVDDLTVGQRVSVRLGTDPGPAAGGGLPHAEQIGAA